MKKYLYLSAIAMMAGFAACEDDTTETKTAAEQQIEAVAEELATIDGVSASFIAELNKLNLSNSSEQAFTVFAVRSESTKSLKAETGDLNVSRHVVIGAYTLADLTYGLTLTALNGDKLAVETSDDKVYTKVSQQEFPTTISHLPS
ncbi:hypothetical protein FACS189430_12400 [Bacteroidia bacterium]|nr:hypothetical protein FACS189430_12400 [Bacteroidia bacterium]